MSKVNKSALLSSFGLAGSVAKRNESGKYELNKLAVDTTANITMREGEGAPVTPEEVGEFVNKIIDGLNLESGTDALIKSVTDGVRISIVESLNRNSLEFISSFTGAVITACPILGKGVKTYLQACGFGLKGNNVVTLAGTRESVMAIVNDRNITVQNARIKGSAEKSAPLTLCEVIGKKSESIGKALDKVNTALRDTSKFKESYVAQLNEEKTQLALEVKRSKVATMVANCDAELLAKIEELIALHS